MDHNDYLITKELNEGIENLKSNYILLDGAATAKLDGDQVIVESTLVFSLPTFKKAIERISKKQPIPQEKLSKPVPAEVSKTDCKKLLKTIGDLGEYEKIKIDIPALTEEQFLLLKWGTLWIGYGSKTLPGYEEQIRLSYKVLIEKASETIL